MTFLDAPTIPPEVLQLWKEKQSSAFQEKISALSETEFQKDYLAQFFGGPSLASLKGLGPEHIDALLVKAHNELKAGSIPAACDTLMLVMALDPNEDRAVYTLASILQMKGCYYDAGLLYMRYIMLKAMEPRGYLRIGECLLGDDHIAEAREYITGALNLATEAGDTLTQQQAKTMLSQLEQRDSAVAL